MKLISWNVDHRSRGALTQVEALGKQEPDVVALQDVNANSVSFYKSAFPRIGLAHVAHTLQDNSENKKPTGVLIASRYQLDRLSSGPLAISWPEKVCQSDIDKVMSHWTKRTLFATLKSPWGEIDLYNVYITPYNHKEPTTSGIRKLYPWIKFNLLAGIYQVLSTHTNRLRILCGDFNTPQAEKINGEIVTWGYKKMKDGNFVLKDPQQDKLELSVLRGLQEYDIYDVYRSYHGYANCGTQEACSWRSYRYDDVFASQALSPLNIRYLQDSNISTLSDHFPIEVVFAFKNIT